MSRYDEFSRTFALAETMACPKKLTNNWESNEEIQILREYLRIPSVHPDVDYGKSEYFSIEFLFLIF